MTTNVPTIQFTPTGLVIPSDSDVMTGVLADLNQAFGGNINPALNTPQGLLASSLTATISNCYALIAMMVNGMDPDLNSGFMQDCIARIYFLNREPGTPTVVSCVCVGLLGTNIKAGALAKDSAGNTYVCLAGGAIPVSGSITLPFANVVNGPIGCPANSLTTIYQAVPGWDSINNPADGVPGVNVESREAFEFRRENSVALNAHGSLQAIYAAVFDVAGVTDCYAIENVTSSTVVFGSTNYPVVAHSVYVAVIGGSDADVAQAIWTKKDLGCDTNGNTSVTVVDTSGYAPPQPSYTIKFERPPALPILFAVQIANSSTLPADIVNQVKTAIVNAFTGADGSAPVRIGSLLLAAKFYGPIVAIGPTVSVLSILLGSSTPTQTSQQIGIDQAPTVTASNITVTLV